MKHLKSFNENIDFKGTRYSDLVMYCQDILLELNDLDYKTEVRAFLYQGHIDIFIRHKLDFDVPNISDVAYSLDEYLKSQGFSRKGEKWDIKTKYDRPTDMTDNGVDYHELSLVYYDDKKWPNRDLAVKKVREIWSSLD